MIRLNGRNAHFGHNLFEPSLHCFDIDLGKLFWCFLPKIDVRLRPVTQRLEHVVWTYSRSTITN